jgi:hypothetical protein
MNGTKPALAIVPTKPLTGYDGETVAEDIHQLGH